MKYLAVFVFLSLPAMAEPEKFFTAYHAAQDAHEDCQGAWFQRGREKALDAINANASIMASNLDKSSPTITADSGRVGQVTQWLKSCARLAHPNSGLFGG